MRELDLQTRTELNVIKNHKQELKRLRYETEQLNRELEQWKMCSEATRKKYGAESEKCDALRLKMKQLKKEAKESEADFKSRMKKALLVNEMRLDQIAEQDIRIQSLEDLLIPHLHHKGKCSWVYNDYHGPCDCGALETVLNMNNRSEPKKR